MEYSQGETTNGELDAPSDWKFWLKFFASFMSIFIHLAGLYGMKTRKPKFMWPWICAFAMASKVFVSLNYTLANLLYFPDRVLLSFILLASGPLLATELRVFSTRNFESP
jgi:hypothetical protein